MRIGLRLEFENRKRCRCRFDIKERVLETPISHIKITEDLGKQKLSNGGAGWQQ